MTTFAPIRRVRRQRSGVEPSATRPAGLQFQNYALYPQMSVEDNMGFAVKMAKVPKDERKRWVGEAAGILGLTEYLQRKPKALSGGQRRWVARRSTRC